MKTVLILLVIAAFVWYFKFKKKNTGANSLEEKIEEKGDGDSNIEDGDDNPIKP